MVNMNRPLIDMRQFKEYISVLEKALNSVDKSDSPIKFIPISQEMVNPLNHPTYFYQELQKVGNDRLKKMIELGIRPIKIINDSDGNFYCSKDYAVESLVSNKEINQAIDILTTYATVREWQDKMDDLPKLKALEGIL